MREYKLNFSKKSYIYLDKRETANFKALLGFFKSSVEDDFTISEIIEKTYKKNKANNKNISYRALRSMIYLLIASNNLNVRQKGRARIIFITKKLKEKIIK